MKNISKFFKPANLISGYTLMELIIAGIILGFITVVAWPSFRNMIERQYCKTAQMNLIAIYSASKIYHAKHGTYILASAAPQTQSNLSAINHDLGIAIDDPRFTYTFDNGSGANTLDYSARAVRAGNIYQCIIAGQPLSGTTPKNPDCFSASQCGSNYLGL